MGDLQRRCTCPAQARELLDQLEAKVAAQSTFRAADHDRAKGWSSGGPGSDEPPD